MQSQSGRALARLSTRALSIESKRKPSSFRRFATVADQAPKDPAEFDQISTLSNGMRVATEALPGPFSGIGVYVDAGSRYESQELCGVSHIIDRLAFKSTGSRTSDEMLEALETLGGNIQCASSRESLMYQSASFNSSVPTTLGLLAETIRDPLITELEVEQQLDTAEYEIKEIWSKPDLILPELVNIAAYKDNTLGNPLLCPQERLQFINKAVVEKYRNAFFHPERMVVAFAGVAHEEAMTLAEKYFGNMHGQQGPSLSQFGSAASYTDTQSRGESSSPSSSSSSSSSHTPTYSSPSTTPPSSPQTSRLLSHVPFLKNLSTSASAQASISSIDPLSAQSNLNLNTPSHYTGGFLSLPPLPPPANPSLPDLTYIHLAFEALPISSEDIYALATLQTLLGGGGSFSAGGPGKGMYSRLYTNVLNQHGWVESCVAFNHSYTDSGLFGISASCSPLRAWQMLEVMCRELQNLTLDTGFSALQTVEVNRAKNQLRSSLLMNLESRMVELEDLGRQVQVHGRKVGVKEMCRKIDALTVKDLRRVARLVFGGNVQNAGKGSGAPTVVLQEGSTAEGRVDFGWERIQEKIQKWKLGKSSYHSITSCENGLDEVLSNSRRAAGYEPSELRHSDGEVEDGEEVMQQKGIEACKQATDGFVLRDKDCESKKLGMLPDYDRVLAQFNTNLFGTLAITQAVLPHFRQKRAGIVAFIGSMDGWVAAPGAGLYSGTKFALEGLVESLQLETFQFGIKSIIFEPGSYRTKLMNPINVHTHPSRISDYEEMSTGIAGFLVSSDNKQPGDPRKLVDRIIDVVKSEGMAAGKPTPPRLPVGRDALAAIRKKCEDTLSFCEEWENLITSTDIDADE